MNRPEPTATAIEENTVCVVPAVSWGEKEAAREIALLEAHVRQEKIKSVIDEAIAAVEAHNAPRGGEWLHGKILPICIEEELHQSYFDYAMSVIVNGHVSSNHAISVLRSLSLRAMAHFRHFANGLSVAMAIFRIKERSRTFLNLSKAAESACNRVPLFAYGPELSEFRHRFR